MDFTKVMHVAYTHASTVMLGVFVGREIGLRVMEIVGLVFFALFWFD